MIRNSITHIKSISIAKRPSLLFLLFAFTLAPLIRGSEAATLPELLNQQEHQTAQEMTALELGKPIERELSAGQKHSYQVSLTEGQFVPVSIRRKGINAGMTFRPPGSEVVTVVDVATLGEEWSSIYQYDVYASTKAPTGRYEIWIAELRTATEDDRELQRAWKLWMEFWRLHRQGKHLEARPFLIRSVEIREKVLGSDNLAIAEFLGQLSTNYGNTGDHASAEPLRLRELKVTEKALGSDHPAVASVLIRRVAANNSRSLASMLTT